MGTIAGTATIANAVMDALAPLGIRHLDMPLTAEKIYDAIHNRPGNGSGSGHTQFEERYQEGGEHVSA
jgi:hypothetical protein